MSPANPVRRTVVAIYTDHAPMDAGNYETFPGVTPVQAVGRLLERLRRAAGELISARTSEGDIAILTPAGSPLAFLNGLTADEAGAALAHLRLS